MHTDEQRVEIRRRLRTKGDIRTLARMVAAEMSGEIRDLALIAVEAGLSKKEIAELAQISRPALDTMLREGENDEPVQNLHNGSGA
jgi:DNA-binding transcriptional regulator LsrR (DeoR family)